jgi:hypothetical protein
MKKLRFAGIIALAAVIGFAMAGCEQPTDSPTAKTLTGITLNTDAVKKVYIQNETLNLSGLVVTANYSDGSKAAVTSYTADPANGATLSTIETKTVTISYTEEAVTKTANFSVTVAAKALSGLTAEYTGTTHVYPFTPLDSLKDHLAVTAQYNDGTSATLDAKDYTLSGNLTAGTSTITASYTEGGATKTDTFDVTVTDATLDSIEVEFDQDDATIYTSTPLDNLKQYLTVTAFYTFTGSQETHEETLSAHEYTLSGTLTAGTPTITVNYGDKTGNFTPTVTAVVLTGITAQYSATTIYTSTPLDNLKQHLTVTASYNDGNEKTVTANDYTLNGSLITAGTQTITANYTEGGVTKTATFDVTVTAVALVSITASYTGGQVEINSNVDDLKTALTITAHYNDGSTQTPSNYSLSGPVNAIGQKTITASYTDDGVTKTDTFTVTVVCTNHNWSNWTKTKTATVTEDGEETATCSICGTIGETTRFSGEYATGTAGLAYDLIDNNTAYRVRKGTVTNNTVHIPAYHRPNASSQYLPVTEITTDGGGYGAFFNTAITAIYIPASVTTISSNTFWQCTSLATVTFAEGSQLQTIQGFTECSSLTAITIPASVTSIGNRAFSQCTSLTGSITIPASVTSIGSDAFYNCSSLTNITIGAGVTAIGENAFGSCHLTSITVNENNPNYASEGGILYNKVKTSLILVPTAITGEITIPTSVTSIVQYAFLGCFSLTSITLPTGLMSIGNGTFSNCTNLTSINIPASVTSIGNYAFYLCSSLTSITIPASVTTIGLCAFDDCTSLTSVTFAGTIASASFNSTTPFPGDLRAKFYATNSANGTPGTYTRPSGTSTTWTRQP